MLRIENAQPKNGTGIVIICPEDSDELLHVPPGRFADLDGTKAYRVYFHAGVTEVEGATPAVGLDAAKVQASAPVPTVVLASESAHGGPDVIPSDDGDELAISSLDVIPGGPGNENTPSGDE